MKNALTDTQRQIEERRKQIAEITAEQTRLRGNLGAVDKNNDYAIRMVKKLNDQETNIERLQSEIAGLQEAMNKQRKELEDFLQGTNVG
jgi:chromosome segregation ATPase